MILTQLHLFANEHKLLKNNNTSLLLCDESFLISFRFVSFFTVVQEYKKLWALFLHDPQTAFFYYLSNQPKHQLKKRKKESFSALDWNRKHHSELQSTKCVISAPRSVPLSTIGRVNGVSLTVTSEIIRDLAGGG